MQAQQTAAAQQMAQLESYSATSEQLFGTACNPHPVTGVDPNDTPIAATPGALFSMVQLVYFVPVVVQRCAACACAIAACMLCTGKTEPDV